MDRNLTVRLIVILLVVGLGLFLLYPTYRYFSKYRKLTPEQVSALSEGERRNMRAALDKSMKLGLDLQGGMHVVLGLDRGVIGAADARDAQDRVMEVEKVLLRDASGHHRGALSANPDGSADLLLSDRGVGSFLLLVTLGKLARYAALAWLV